MNPLRIGIIGCGNVLSAYWPQCQRLFLEGRAEVIAACGRPAQRELVTERLGIKRFVLNYREIIDAPEIDLVLVLTSTPSHYEITKAALLAGKHVLCEKPMATSLEQARELADLGGSGPGVYVPAPFTILSPTYQAIASRIAAGEIGKVCAARGRYGWAGPWWSDWFYRAGAGPLFDLACYNITSLVGWLGPVKRVMAMTGVAISPREVNGRPFTPQVPDNVHVLLDFGEARFAHVLSGFVIQQYRSPALELYGSEGTIQMLGDDWDPEGYELWRNDVGAWQFFKETEPDWPWTAGLAHLVECVESGTRPLVTPEHALHVLEVMLAAEDAGRDGRPREVHSTFQRPRFAAVGHHELAHLMHDRTRKELEVHETSP